MKTKRIPLKVIVILFILLLTVIGIIVAEHVIYNKIATDDVTIRQNYEKVQEKYELLKIIAMDTVEENKGIEVNQLSREGIQYKIYNDGDNIIIHYYIDEKINEEYPYRATITLSNDYKILDEQYSEQKSFETYKRGIQILEKVLSFALAALAVGIFYIVCCIIQGVCCVVRWIYRYVNKSKDGRNTINNHPLQEMRKNFAGEYIKNPQELPNGCRVTVFDKSSEHWWEHGEIYTRKKDAKKAVNCGDGIYEFNEVEVYLDTRYS